MIYKSNHFLVSGILDGFNEFLNRVDSSDDLRESEKVEELADQSGESEGTSSIFRLFHPQLELAIALQNANAKYTGDIAEQKWAI